MNVGQTLHTGVAAFSAERRRSTRVGSINTADGRITDFRAVTEKPIAAQRVLRNEITGVGDFVATVDGAGDTIITIDRGAILARTADASLESIAVKTIIAMRARQTLDTSIGEFIAELRRATGVRSVDATIRRMADFQAIAVQVVVTRVALRCVVARIRGLVARIQGAADSVVAAGGSSRRASSALASLQTIAMQAIVAVRVGQTVHTGIGVLVTKCRRSAWVNGVGTTTRGMTNFRTIAVITVLAGSMIRCVGATVTRFVTGVNRAGNTVVTIGRSSGLTYAIYAYLDPVAMCTVVAMFVG